MPKIVWNGKFEITPKEIGVAVWLVWMSAMGWYKLEALQKTVEQHLAEASVREQTTSVQGSRLNVLEERIDDCCPRLRERKRR